MSYAPGGQERKANMQAGVTHAELLGWGIGLFTAYSAVIIGAMAAMVKLWIVAKFETQQAKCETHQERMRVANNRIKDLEDNEKKRDGEMNAIRDDLTKFRHTFDLFVKQFEVADIVVHAMRKRSETDTTTFRMVTDD